MHSKRRDDAKLKLSGHALAQLSKLATLLQASNNLNLSERDLQFLLRLLAQGALLDPALHAQLMSILVRSFNLRHIPLRMPHWWHLVKRRGVARFSSNARGTMHNKWPLVPYKRDLLASLATNSLTRKQLDSRSHSCSSLALSHMSSRANARKLLLLAFYNAPLFNSFSCILLRIGRDNLRHMLASLLAASAAGGRLPLNALEYFDDDHGHGQIALNALCREFAGEVRLVRTNVAPSLNPKCHECTLSLSLITHACLVAAYIFKRN